MAVSLCRRVAVAAAALRAKVKELTEDVESGAPTERRLMALAEETAKRDAQVRVMSAALARCHPRCVCGTVSLTAGRRCHACLQSAQQKARIGDLSARLQAAACVACGCRQLLHNSHQSSPRGVINTGNAPTAWTEKCRPYAAQHPW